MHYDESSNTLTASMELPGVTPTSLRVTLGTCYFNHVKYVGVTAESSPPFAAPEWSAEVLQAVRAEMEKGLAAAGALKVGRIVNPNLRERRFGIMRRLIQVPSRTTVSVGFLLSCSTTAFFFASSAMCFFFSRVLDDFIFFPFFLFSFYAQYTFIAHLPYCATSTIPSSRGTTSTHHYKTEYLL